MTIMVTGGTGFVGLALTEALLTRGEHVVVYALDAPPPAALRVFAGLPGKLTSEIGSVTDPEALTSAMRRHAVDRLFPFAAITAGPARERDVPEQILQVNLVGFVSQLRAARDAGVRRVVAPSSGASYGDSFLDHALLDEATTPCVPSSLYGVTKYAVERTALRLGEGWGLDVMAARIGSVFGPWERDTGLRDMLGPHWQLSRIAVQGGHAVLPAVIPPYAWIYARDIASGLVHLLDLPPGETRLFNICSGQDWGARILEWCAKLAASFPGFSWSQSADPAAVTIRFSETRPRGRMDISRLAATGWVPRFGPEAAYADYLDWVTTTPDAFAP
jgi:nucleoside-diphosphate-sugar epimerase